MAIKNFPTKAAYDAAVKSTIDSEVAMIENDKSVKYDGVNVITLEPVCGDALFLDENNKPVIIKGGSAIQKANIPAAWTYIGEVNERVSPDTVAVINKDISATRKFLGVSQFAWTTSQTTEPIILDGEQHSKTIGLRFGIPNWDTTTSITFTYTATTLAQAAAACQAAIEAKLAELEATAAVIAEWWAYADEDNNRVIIQRDNCTDYRYYNCSGVTNIVWDDMPATDNAGYRVNNVAGNQRIMNVARGAAYYGTNGSTPTANVPLNSATTIVTSAAFSSSPYCAALREAYGTYANYIKKEYQVKFPQKLGVFALPDGDTLTKKYGPMTVPTKSGSTMAKFPALNWALSVGYNGEGLEAGNWHLWDVRDGSIFMDDDNRAKINATRSKMGVTQIANSTSRWFAQRSDVNSAWIFSGGNGTLSISGVYYAGQVGAVTLCKFK